MDQDSRKITITVPLYYYRRLTRLSKATGDGMATLSLRPVLDWIRSTQFTHELQEAEKQSELEVNDSEKGGAKPKK